MNASTGEHLAVRSSVASRRSADVARMATDLAVVVVVSLLLAPTLQSLRVEWIDTTNLTYTHGYLVCALCVWLLLRTARDSSDPMAPDARLALPLVLLSFCWLLALRAGIELLHQVLFPLIVMTALCVATGLRNGLRQWPACAYFYFAVPVWTLGTGILQAISTFAVKVMLRLTGIPAYVDGNVVHIPEGAFEIAGGCSGIHYFIVALALAAIFGEIHRDSWKVRLRLLFLAALLAMISNWVRIYVVIVAGHLTDMQHYFVRVDHYVFGWALYAVSMGLFIWLASRTPLGAPRPGRPLSVPPMSLRKVMTGVALAVVATAAGPGIGALAPVRAADAHTQPLLVTTPGWEGPVPAAGPWKPNYPHSDRSELAEYRRDGMVVNAFVAEYDSQRQGKELVGFENSLLAGIEGDMAEHVVTHYYDIGGTRRNSALAEQITYAMASLSGPQVSRIVAVEVACARDCAHASERADELLQALFPMSVNRP